MFFFQFIDNQLDGFFFAHFVDLARSLHGLRERLEHLGGRTAQAETGFVVVDLVGTPNFDFPVVGLDDAADGHVTGFKGGSQHGQQALAFHFEDLDAVFVLLVDQQVAVVEQLGIANVGDLGQTEVFGHFGTHLCGVAIDGLTAAMIKS